MYDRLEIWSLEEWNSYLARMEEKYETSLNKILNVLYRGHSRSTFSPR